MALPDVVRAELGGMIDAALAEGLSARQFAGVLYRRFHAIVGHWDWERVARTELMDTDLRRTFVAAQSSGRFTNDTTIYRIPALIPCNGCLRLYLTADGLPRIYTVADVVVADATGRNRGPMNSWHVRIGICHANCVCGPWTKWLPVLRKVFSARAESRAELWRRRLL